MIATLLLDRNELPEAAFLIPGMSFNSPRIHTCNSLNLLNLHRDLKHRKAYSDLMDVRPTLQNSLRGLSQTGIVQCLGCLGCLGHPGHLGHPPHTNKFWLLTLALAHCQCWHHPCSLSCALPILIIRCPSWPCPLSLSYPSHPCLFSMVILSCSLTRKLQNAKRMHFQMWYVFAFALCNPLLIPPAILFTLCLLSAYLLLTPFPTIFITQLTPLSLLSPYASLCLPM